MRNLLIRGSLLSSVTLSEHLPSFLLGGDMLFIQLLDVIFEISFSLENILLSLQVPKLS